MSDSERDRLKSQLIELRNQIPPLIGVDDEKRRTIGRVSAEPP